MGGEGNARDPRRRRRRAATAGAAALLLLTLPVPCQAQMGPIRGYSLTVGTASESSPFGEAGAVLLQRLRLMVSPRAGPLEFDVAYEHAVQLQSASLTPASPIGVPVATTWLDLQWNLVDEEHVRWDHRFDRLWMGAGGSAWEVTVGRQTVSWATTLFLTPADPFAPFDPSDPFREYRAGVDAARVQLYPGSLSDVDVVVRPSDTPDGTTLTALARGRNSLGDAEVSGWAGLVHDEAGAALGVSRSVGPMELRAEASLRENPDAGGAVLRMSVGADRLFTLAGRDLYVVLEYQHDGFGAADASELLETARSPAFGRGELQVLGKDEAALSGAYQVHPLWSLDLLTLLNLRDGSGLLVPAASYSVGAEVALRGGVFFSFGDSAASLEQGLASEYGAVPTSAYLSLTWFF